MTKSANWLLALIMLLATCAPKNTINETPDTNKPEPRSKLSRLRSIRDSLGFVALPFKAVYDSSITPNYRLYYHTEDSLIMKEFGRLGGDPYMVGFLPDTSRYYGIVFYAVAAAAIPGIITIDKQGQRISVEYLTNESCADLVAIYCREFTTINPDLTLNYYSKLLFESDLTKDTSDTLCTQYVRRGKITTTGVIELGTMETIDCSKK